MKRTLQILDIDHYGEDSIVNYGYDRAFEQYGRVLDRYNDRESEAEALFVDRVDDKYRGRHSDVQELEMVEVDIEFGAQSDDQVPDWAFQEWGFELRGFDLSQSWTKLSMAGMTVRQANSVFSAALAADKKRMRDYIWGCIFNNVNYNIVDRTYMGETLAIKTLYNADGWYIPNGPNGEQFNGSTHIHHMVLASFSYANLMTGYNNLAEHMESGQTVLLVNKDEVPDFAAMSATTFYPAEDGRIIASLLADRINRDRDPLNESKRFIGIMKYGPEVWTHPDVPSGYAVLVSLDSNLGKALKGRKHPALPSGLRLVNVTGDTDETAGRILKRTIGYSVESRGAVVVMKKDAGLGAYTRPTRYNKWPRTS
jgi:hypothetical protein